MNKKIAFIFITIGDLRQPDLWGRYFDGNWDKASVYIHSKNPSEIKTPWILENSTIVSSVDNAYGYITEASLHASRIALGDPRICKFVLLSESCIPLRPFEDLYSRSINNEKESIIDLSNLKINDIIKYIEPIKRDLGINSVKHSSWWILSRYHLIKLLNSPPEQIQYLHKMFLGDEYMLSLIDPRPGIDNITQGISSFTNWKDPERLKKVIKKHADASHPKTYSETVTKEEISEALDSGAYFWRKFSKCNLPWDYLP